MAHEREPLPGVLCLSLCKSRRNHREFPLPLLDIQETKSEEHCAHSCPADLNPTVVHEGTIIIIIICIILLFISPIAVGTSDGNPSHGRGLELDYL